MPISKDDAARIRMSIHSTRLRAASRQVSAAVFAAKAREMRDKGSNNASIIYQKYSAEQHMYSRMLATTADAMEASLAAELADATYTDSDL